MSTLDFESGVFYPRRGMPSLVEDLQALDTTSNVHYFYDSPVTRITHEGSLATGIELTSGAKITADIVISAADLHHTETQLVAPEVQTYPEKKMAVTSAEPGRFGYFTWRFWNAAAADASFAAVCGCVERKFPSNLFDKDYSKSCLGVCMQPFEIRPIAGARWPRKLIHSCTNSRRRHTIKRRGGVSSCTHHQPNK